MIGETISHYPPEADPPLADKILYKLGADQFNPAERDYDRFKHEWENFEV